MKSFIPSTDHPLTEGWDQFSLEMFDEEFCLSELCLDHGGRTLQNILFWARAAYIAGFSFGAAAVLHGASPDVLKADTIEALDSFVPEWRTEQ
jgi:hypothetical protein